MTDDGRQPHVLIINDTQDTGWKFLTLSRLDPEVGRIPLILCTAAVLTVRDHEMAAQLEHVGVRVVLQPFNLDELITVLAETLATRTAESGDGETFSAQTLQKLEALRHGHESSADR